MKLTVQVRLSFCKKENEHTALSEDELRLANQNKKYSAVFLAGVSFKMKKKLLLSMIDILFQHFVKTFLFNPSKCFCAMGYVVTHGVLFTLDSQSTCCKVALFNYLQQNPFDFSYE